jgi:hypothetical protein
MTQTFRLSLFQHKRDTKPQVVERTWQQFCANFQKPEIRAEKDGLLFSPAFFEPAYLKKQNVRELSMLVLDIDHNAELQTLKTRLAALNSTYVIYSTHSHLRRTDKNPNAEPRFRVCLPLASAIPAKDFPALWQSIKQITGLPLDENAKDESRMFYVPSIAAPDAPYVFEVSDGAFLDWRKLTLDTLSADANTNGNNHKTDSALIFDFHEDRHAELCRRIEAQAKQTGRGTFEMKCPAHNGNGNSSLFYAPETKSVKCLNQCDYFAIVHAFGLSNEHLPSREYASKSSHSNTKEKQPLKRLKTVKMSDIETKPVEWLWQDYIPLGAFTILEGEEELGKTWILCVVAGAAAQGYGLPNNPPGEPATVLMMSAEDSLSFVIKPRLEAVKAPCEKIIAIDEHFTLDADGIFRLSLELAAHAPKLVIIDPLFSYTGKIKLNDDNDIRSITDELTRLAEKYGCAIVGVRHIGKSKGMGDPRNAGLNGIGWRASARVVLLVGKDPNDERQRAIVQTKNNLAPRAEKAQGYEIIGSEFFWKESSLTAKMMLSIPKNDEERGEQSEAVAFLREALRDGKRNAGEVTNEAEKLGITKQKLRTARNKLGIKPRNEGYGKDKQWFWELPKTDCLDVVSSHLEVNSKQNQHLSANGSGKTIYSNNLPLDVNSVLDQHLSANNQHLSSAKNEDLPKCSNCGLEMNLIENGKTWFCPFGCESRNARF